MLSRVRDPATRVVYAAALVVGTAYGVSIALTALRMNALGFGKPAIGSLAAVFASGIVAASRAGMRFLGSPAKTGGSGVAVGGLVGIGLMGRTTVMTTVGTAPAAAVREGTGVPLI